MRVREAKNFLVEQTAQPAAIEGVSLSDLERRMMYFTESEDAVEDPIRLNQEFEAEFDTDEYELKISGLLRRAYKRVKEENPATVREWDEAVRELRKGDHYLLVFWNDRKPQALISKSFWKLLAVALLVLIISMVGFVAALHHADSMPPRPNAIGSLPPWIQHLLLALVIGSYLAFLLLPRFIGRIF